MKKIAITGLKGTIETVIKNGLKKYIITPIDLPETDARQYLLEELDNTLMPNKNLTSLYNVKNGEINVSVIDNL